MILKDVGTSGRQANLISTYSEKCKKSSKTLQQKDKIEMISATSLSQFYLA